MTIGFSKKGLRTYCTRWRPHIDALFRGSHDAKLGRQLLKTMKTANKVVRSHESSGGLSYNISPGVNFGSFWPVFAKFADLGLF